jgi:hypothetical protein
MSNFKETTRVGKIQELVKTQELPFLGCFSIEIVEKGLNMLKI